MQCNVVSSSTNSFYSKIIDSIIISFKKEQLSQPTTPLFGRETLDGKQLGSTEKNPTVVEGTASHIVIPQVQIDIPPVPDIILEPSSGSHTSEAREPSTKDESTQHEHGIRENDTKSTDGVGNGGDPEPEDPEETKQQQKIKKRKRW